MNCRPLFAFALAAALVIGGCVSIPIPPSDMGAAKAGELGTLHLRLAASYEPNWAGTVQAGLRQWAGGGGKEVKKPTR
jgi:hypothetical protein